MEECPLLRPWLQTWWAPQDSCTFALYCKALGVRDRHTKGTKILTSVWISAFWIQNQTWFQLGWIQHDIKRTEGHPHLFPQPACENISHLTRQSQSCSYQSLCTSNKLVLENPPNITDQSVFTTSCFLCWIQGAYKPATTFTYLIAVYFRQQKLLLLASNNPFIKIKNLSLFTKMSKHSISTTVIPIIHYPSVLQSANNLYTSEQFSWGIQESVDS